MSMLVEQTQLETIIGRRIIDFILSTDFLELVLDDGRRIIVRPNSDTTLDIRVETWTQNYA